MRLLLIRHAESLANAEGRLQGHLDIALSERGRQQAERVAERLAPLGIDALYTSTLGRAKQTAEIIGQRLGLPLQERPALMERNVGELEGLTREEIIARYPRYVVARTEVRRVEIVGFEQDEAFAQRAKHALAAIIETHAQETVAVVTHGGIIFSFCRQTFGMPTVRPGPLAVNNGSITTFEIVRGEAPRTTLVTLNDTCHLDGL